MYYCYLRTPVGKLLLAGDDHGLRQVDFQDGPHPAQPDPAWRQDEKPFRAVIQQLREYFDGERRSFDLPLAPAGTAFQLKVWHALRGIPYGKTWSYGELARRIKRPKASRAVGAANGQNPLPIIVPCHRVIGTDGSLTGFGGGLKIKQQLLELESGERRLL
ncbi:MAG: methylated-DNA--[protein]-cysteine S-methyltransferase [Gammaproteobacteria bacterium]|nr:methylated-DNA--[protein]-cysteine S-methyltransferase [Gammaproteobacteria bacterium]MDE2024730.1 methylated-DNA--[protein]-cysteine S-methyltransferase [Gammaproteobacteria bacterium]MDE2140663.1 methylated-DNA--[protein]-cysteine S-methyltransferase [Gammaproteobacteria bacterium]MDE2274159.1 methylated-DNA--[protein]-cysteine S-methyltransferase [Gammaproteobacteria bacterium]